MRWKAKYPCYRFMSAGASLGVITLVILFSIYSFLMVLLYISLHGQDNDGFEDYDRLIIWSIVQASVGFKSTNYYNWPLIACIQGCLLTQLFFHIPFIYYIGKENVMIAYDEATTQSMSQMVERVRTEIGDPRFFLAELKKVKLQGQNQPEKQVIIHRMPYMKLQKSVRHAINNTLFTTLFVFTCLMDKIDVIYEIMGTFQSPLD